MHSDRRRPRAGPRPAPASRAPPSLPPIRPCRRYQSRSQVPTPPAAACRAVTPPARWLGSAPSSSRNRANPAWPAMIASGRAWVPSAPGALTSTPAASRARARSTSPFRAANISGVKPAVVSMLGSAPCSSSRRTMAGWGAASPHIRAVLRVSVVAAFTSAPWSRSASTIAALPVRAAVINAVSPLVRAAPPSAPPSSSRSTIARLAFSAARSSGVTPWSSAAFGSAPASSSRSTIPRSSQCAAQTRAVAPSGRLAFTSAPSASSASIAPASWAATASTSPNSCPAESGAAPAATARDTRQTTMARIPLSFAPCRSAATMRSIMPCHPTVRCVSVLAPFRLGRRRGGIAARHGLR